MPARGAATWKRAVPLASSVALATAAVAAYSCTWPLGTGPDTIGVTATRTGTAALAPTMAGASSATFGGASSTPLMTN